MKKKWIAVTSAKGGVGKSVFARLLGEVLRKKLSGVSLFDGDGSVGQMIQYAGTRTDGKLDNPQDPLKGVGSFKFLSHGSESVMRDALRALTTDLANAPGPVLLDLPGSVARGDRGLRTRGRSFGRSFLSRVGPRPRGPDHAVLPLRDAVSIRQCSWALATQ